MTRSHLSIFASNVHPSWASQCIVSAAKKVCRIDWSSSHVVGEEVSAEGSTSFFWYSTAMTLVTVVSMSPWVGIFLSEEWFALRLITVVTLVRCTLPSSLVGNNRSVAVFLLSVHSFDCIAVESELSV